MIARDGRRKVALFGLAFKPGTDDTVATPSVRSASSRLRPTSSLTRMPLP